MAKGKENIISRLGNDARVRLFAFSTIGFALWNQFSGAEMPWAEAATGSIDEYFAAGFVGLSLWGLVQALRNLPGSYEKGLGAKLA